MDTNKTTHIGSTSLFNQYYLEENHEKAAYHYWNSEKTSLILNNGIAELMPQEFLTLSNVQVLECICDGNSSNLTHNIDLLVPALEIS